MKALACNYPLHSIDIKSVGECTEMRTNPIKMGCFKSTQRAHRSNETTRLASDQTALQQADVVLNTGFANHD
eukprot:1541347-Pleurochrysis_carterae.AAC.4